jgi:predicted N-acetyltransferase YhbS
MEQEVVIRSARPADMPAVAAAYEWLFVPPGQRPPHWDEANAVRALHQVSSSDRSDVLIAGADGNPVGFCTVYLDILSVRFGQRSWVEDLAVQPDRRSQGVGRRLLTAAEDWARRHGATHLELDSGNDAHEHTGSTKAGNRHRAPNASAGPSDRGCFRLP